MIIKKHKIKKIYLKRYKTIKGDVWDCPINRFGDVLFIHPPVDSRYIGYVVIKNNKPQIISNWKIPFFRLKWLLFGTGKDR
jgi:hypothetical protein